MKNPQNYKKYYKAFNELKEEILTSIKDELSKVETQSISFADTFLSICTLQIVDDEKSVIAMGVTLNEDMSITVHAGIYEPEQTYIASSLDMHTLLRLYKVFEEAIFDLDHQPMEELE